MKNAELHPNLQTYLFNNINEWWEIVSYKFPCLYKCHFWFYKPGAICIATIFFYDFSAFVYDTRLSLVLVKMANGSAGLAYARVGTFGPLPLWPKNGSYVQAECIGVRIFP
jgi:hypothetical protein